MTEQPKKPQSGSRNTSIGLILLVVALVALFLWQSGSKPNEKTTANPTPTAATTVSSAVEETPTPVVPQQVSDLPPIAYNDLPPEAHDTIGLIDQGGPYPFDKDGSTFQNREGLLPAQPTGYFSEYTVITPGSSDRGARRIVAGEAGEMYYTGDHYATFQEVIR